MKTGERSSDHQAIVDVLVRFTHAEDRRDMDLLRTCLTNDARLDFGAVTPPLEGLDAIVAALREMLGRFTATQHFLTNFAIEVEGDEASSTSYVLAYHTTAAGGLLVIGGTQEDRLRRTPSGWRLHRRRFTLVWTTDSAARAQESAR